LNNILTEDGSFTCYSEEFDEHYHSIKEGALKESLKKHIEPAFSLISQKDEVTILDICYGLGFNTLSTLYYLRHSTTKVYIKSPEFDENLVKSLVNFPYPKEFEPFTKIIKTLSETGFYEDSHCSIEIYFGNAREYLNELDITFDIVYQDAFSPKKNPLLWTYEYFNDVTRLLKKDGVITTYSSATPIRMSMYKNSLKIYENENLETRTGTIASKSELAGLKEIDMILKQQRNKEARATYDAEYSSFTKDLLLKQ